jgi:SAM-dependent methyltransferase
MKHQLEDIASYNRFAWDEQVKRGNRWTVPVSPEMIAEARKGNWEIVLTPSKPVPRSWFPPVAGLRVLCLASGGGQQVPILAAAGAIVTVVDNSPAQLAQDRFVAHREGLQLTTILGDMQDLSELASESFDLVFNPCSVAFISNVQPVFDEAFRVLRPGGWLMCGFINPIRFIFDEEQLTQGQLVARHRLPYSDRTHLTEAELEKLKAECEPLVFSHSLEELIGGQLRARFRLLDLFEDGTPHELLSEFIPTNFATLALKPLD